MHIVLQSENSQLVAGILLAAGPRRMRIVVERQKDTLELRLVRGRWLSDNGSPMEIAFLASNEVTQAVPGESRTLAAGAAW